MTAGQRFDRCTRVFPRRGPRSLRCSNATALAVGPAKTDSSRGPAADPLGPLCIPVDVRKRLVVSDNHGRVDRAGFSPLSVAFETGCCALDPAPWTQLEPKVR